MKKTLILFLTILITISFYACSSGEAKETLKWGMSESQVRQIKNISDDIKAFSIDDYTWITCENQKVFGITGRTTYNFDNAELVEVGFSAIKIANVEEMDEIYSTLKENVILIYGEPVTDFQKDEGVQYHYAQWNIGSTTAIRLQANKDEMYVSLDCTSIAVFGVPKLPETSTSAY